MDWSEKSSVRNTVFDPEAPARRRKKRSKLQERRVAKKLGGSRVPLSGADDRAKGDIITKELLVEQKYTDKNSFSIKRQWLEKISIEARAVGKVPALGFSFENQKEDFIVPKDWIAIPVDFFREVIDAAHTNNIQNN